MFTLQEALEAVKDKPEFSVNSRPFGTVIDYNVAFEGTFVGKTERETLILKNLRGTCFRPDGNIVRLPFHKFHNLNENPEYAEANFDFLEPHVIEEKLDGSMAVPIKFPDGSWELGTRAGVTDVAKKATLFLFNKMQPTDPKKFNAYVSFIDECLKANLTPIFEYCSRDQRIVIDYIDTKLVLTAVRDNDTGKYANNLRVWVDQFGTSEDSFNLIDIVRTVYTSRSTIGEFAKVVKDLQGEEGVVVKFDDGRFVKIKAADYVMKHRALDGLKFEKDVLRLVLENGIDDVLPLVTPEMKERLINYRDNVLHNIEKWDTALCFAFNIVKAKSGDDRKLFASFATVSKQAPLLFAMYSGKDGSMTSYLKKHLSSQTAVDSVREYIGRSWLEF